MHSRRNGLLSLACLFVLASCSGKDADTTPPADGSADAKAADTAATATTPAIPQADLGRPLTAYRELKDGQQIMFLYTAASRLPPDFEKLANGMSREYRQTSDTFRKRDLLEALKPRIEQAIAQAAAEPYAWVQLDGADLQPYDFERKGFQLDEFAADHRRFFTDLSEYSYTWANRGQVLFAPVADEAIAREIEATRTKWNATPSLRIFFFAQSANLDRQNIDAYVTRVQVVGRDGRVLAEYGPDRSQPAQLATSDDPGCTSIDCIARASAGF